MSVERKSAKVNVHQEEDLPLDWERIAILGATIAILFFYTRSAPFPAGTYWDLLFARDFDLNIGWAVLPEALAYSIVQTSASMLGLKTVYHLAFFLLSCIVAVWVFKGKEVLPGIMVLGLFTFGLQPILTLRWTLQLLFLAGLMCMFEGDYLKDSFGVAIIPVAAAASALGLNSWLLLALIVCHVLVDDEYRLTLILCGLIGILFFPEGAASAVAHTPLSTLFQSPEEIKSLTLLGGVFLIPNLIALPRLGEDDLPTMIFYALSGVIALLDPSTLPVFILVGTYLIFLNLAEIKPLSSNSRLFGIILLALVMHLSLFLNPVGFSLNPSVRGEIGPGLTTLITTNFEQKKIDVHDLGELAWKGLIEIDSEDIPLLISHKSKPVTVMNREGMLQWIPNLPPKATKTTDTADREEIMAALPETAETPTDLDEGLPPATEFPPPRTLEGKTPDQEPGADPESEPDAEEPGGGPDLTTSDEPSGDLPPDEPQDPDRSSTEAQEEPESAAGTTPTDPSAPPDPDAAGSSGGEPIEPAVETSTTASEVGEPTELAPGVPLPTLATPLNASDPLEGIPAPAAPDQLPD